MTGNRKIPLIRRINRHGMTALQQDIALRIKQQYSDRPVDLPFPPDFGLWGRTDYLVLLIDDCDICHAGSIAKA
jgi:hypothetical protein